MGFPGGSVAKKKICLPMQLTQEIGFDLWVRKIPQKRKLQRPPVFLPRKSHGRNSLTGYIVHGVTESHTIEHAQAPLS